MLNKSEINAILSDQLDETGVRLWWNMKIKGLGERTPNEVWVEDPLIVQEYVRGYVDPH